LHIEVAPYDIHVTDEALRDLRERLKHTRWPDELPGARWEYGAKLAYMQDLVSYWQTDFDWRVQEQKINHFANYQGQIDGLHIHFIHEHGHGPYPLPLLIVHGWPSSFYEALDILPLLTDPASFGGDPADAFDVIVPSLPGYGFSDRPAHPGMTSRQISVLLVQLMQGLGYERFAAHAYDIGASILGHLCLDFPHHLIGYHTTEPANATPYLGPGAPALSEAERAYVEYQQRWDREEGGYDHIQSTRPQTLAYGLNDSPAGLAAWIIEKWYVWTDPPNGDLNRHFTRDQLLANVMIYWVTETINSANRLYYERDHSPTPRRPEDRIQVPTGVALTTQQIERAPREYLQRIYIDIRSWIDFGRGGHFILLEEPQLVAEALRTFFRPLRHQPA
jgi:pimeloyl-ACP methyl ester carboxylesterase